jgi:hypothetical protein
MRNTSKILFGKPQRKRPLRRPMRRWEVDVKMNPEEGRIEEVDWIHLTQERTSGGLFECGNELSDFIKGGKVLLC